MADEKQVTEYEKKPTNLEITLQALYDYILNSEEYKGLAGKTQVLNSGVANPELGLTTRMEHDLQVSQNAGKIAKKLDLSKHDILMAQIGGLAHDLGHTPFGHDGEKVLDQALKKFNEYYSFKHEQYGAEVLDKILDRFYYESKTKQVEVPDGFNPAYLMLAKHELKRSVKHHTQYYGFRAVNESPVEQCVRLSDTLSFMVTDLSDLLKGYTTDERSEHIVTEERLKKELTRIPGMNEEKLNIIILQLEKLVTGPEGIESLHDELIEEAFSPTRNREKPTTVIDDIKLERDIVTILRDIKYKNTNRSMFEMKAKTVKSITTYYGYLSEKSGMAEPNPEFKSKIEDLVGEKDPRKCYEHLAKINSYMKDNSSVELDANEQRMMHNLLGNDMEDVLTIVERHSNRLIERDLSQYPTLMTVFALHDKLQYDLILGRHPERLDNRTITTNINGKKVVQTTENAIKTRFERIAKFAYAVETDPKRYTNSGKSPDLRKYNGKLIPAFGPIISRPLKYATYAIQQMQNSDFEDERILVRIARELDIRPDSLKEILEIPIEEIRFNTPKLVGSLKQIQEKRTIIKSATDIKGRFKYVPERKKLFGVSDFVKYDETKQKEVLDFITDQTDQRLNLPNDDEGR